MGIIACFNRSDCTALSVVEVSRRLGPNRSKHTSGSRETTVDLACVGADMVIAEFEFVCMKYAGRRIRSTFAP